MGSISMAEWSPCPCPELDGWELSPPALMLLLQVTRQGELRPLDKPRSGQRTWWDTGGMDSVGHPGVRGRSPWRSQAWQGRVTQVPLGSAEGPRSGTSRMSLGLLLGATPGK